MRKFEAAIFSGLCLDRHLIYRLFRCRIFFRREVMVLDWEMGRVIQGLCDAGHREELYRRYGKENVAALAPTLAMADAWAKEKSASGANRCGQKTKHLI
jgi:hypothetical protein